MKSHFEYWPCFTSSVREDNVLTIRKTGRALVTVQSYTFKKPLWCSTQLQSKWTMSRAGLKARSNNFCTFLSASTQPLSSQIPDHIWHLWSRISCPHKDYYFCIPSYKIYSHFSSGCSICSGDTPAGYQMEDRSLRVRSGR